MRLRIPCFRPDGVQDYGNRNARRTNRSLKDGKTRPTGQTGSLRQCRWLGIPDSACHVMAYIIVDVDYRNVRVVAKDNRKSSLKPGPL